MHTSLFCIGGAGNVSGLCDLTMLFVIGIPIVLWLLMIVWDIDDD
jgi:hypothetical protein